MRQFLTESLVLAALGGSLGLLMSNWFTSVLVTMIASGRTLLLSTAPDWGVLAFTAAISVGACLLAGLAPGLRALRSSLNPALKEVATASRPKLGRALVTAQLSISMVLLVGATLFVGTLVKLYGVDRGLRTDGVLMFGLRSSERYAQARSWAVELSVLDRLGSLPGVVSGERRTGCTHRGNLWNRAVQVEGYTFPPGESQQVGFNAVATQYFATLGTPLLGGREFDARDSNAAAPVAIVNESFARRLRRFPLAAGPSRDIVEGVLRDCGRSERCQVPESARGRSEDGLHPLDAARRRAAGQLHVPRPSG